MPIKQSTGRMSDLERFFRFVTTYGYPPPKVASAARTVSKLYREKGASWKTSLNPLHVIRRRRAVKRLRRYSEEWLIAFVRAVPEKREQLDGVKAEVEQQVAPK